MPTATPHLVSRQLIRQATTVVWGSETPLRSPMSIRFESPPPSLEQDEEAQEDAETQVQVFFYRRFFFVNCNVHFNI